MGRVYTVQFNSVTVAAVQDLITAYCGTKTLILHSLVLGSIGQTSVNNLTVRVKRLPVTVTPGSAGTTPTPLPVQPNDTAATFTAHANDTSQATTSGSAQILLSDTFNIINGWMHMPAESDRFVFAPSQACVLELITAPTTGTTMNGTMTIEEAS